MALLPPAGHEHSDGFRPFGVEGIFAKHVVHTTVHITMTLQEQFDRSLPPSFLLPNPFRKLFSWIEQRGLYVDTSGGRIGFLYPEKEMKAGWTKSGRPGGTNIEFAPEGNASLKYWFAREDICTFAG